MRIFSYILTALVAIFIVNVAFSFSFPAYREVLVKVRSSIFPPSASEIQEAKSRETDRLAESLERIDKQMASLSETRQTSTGTSVASGVINPENTSGSTLSGSILPEEEVEPKESDIPLSGLFLSRVMPDVTLKKVENTGFFGIQVMGRILYNTYADDKKNIKVYAFSETYDTLRINMKLTSSIYTLNETDQFFGYTFFLNPTKKDPKDTIVRFITTLEGRAIGIEVPKGYYPTLKQMLLKK